MRVCTPSMPRGAWRGSAVLGRSISQLRIGCSTPLTLIGSCSSASNSPRTWRQLSWLTRTRPGGALCSMRAATLTVAPRMLPSASTPPPSSTRPVCTPTRTLKSGTPCCRRTEGASSRAVSTMPRPARMADSTSSSLASSLPKAASMPSPVYCSTRPCCACTTAVKRSSAPSITAWMVSGSSFWPMAVEPTTSTNSTDTCLSCCWPDPSAASFSRSGASAVSTTASPSSERCASSAAIAAASCSGVLLTAGSGGWAAPQETARRREPVHARRGRRLADQRALFFQQPAAMAHGAQRGARPQPQHLVGRALAHDTRPIANGAQRLRLKGIVGIGAQAHPVSTVRVAHQVGIARRAADTPQPRRQLRHIARLQLAAHVAAPVRGRGGPPRHRPGRSR